VPENFSKIGVPLKDPQFHLKKDIIIASIVRNQEVITPAGKTSLKAHDRVIIVTTNQKLSILEDILE
ncbi:MAG: TrkA C-terminal domain-containing protein, partial [Clostridiales bacterium]|nr:TrkA C-terminal domain-containing protein [Clostridiales bacterium]